MHLFIQQLQLRTQRAGSTPLITYYDEHSGERTELSAQSFANWVDKTAGLLVDELMIEPGQPVRLDLARTAPGHWITLVWVAAAWRACCPVTVGASADAVVEVVGPETAFADPTGTERIACSLHPLGLGFTVPLPDGVLDYGVEVRAQPDRFTGPPPTPDEPAWIDDTRRLTHSDAADERAGSIARRTLVSPGPDPWDTVRQALVEPVLTGGSVVITVGASRDRIAVIALAERVDLPID